MLSSLLFSLGQDTNLFHQWFSCWPCRLVFYLQPPLSSSSYEVMASWRETWGGKNNTWSDAHRECNWQSNCPDDLTFVIKRRAASEKCSRQTAFRGKKNDGPLLKARSLKKKWLQRLRWGLFFFVSKEPKTDLHFHFHAGVLVSE